jgi:hypothetical protein
LRELLQLFQAERSGLMRSLEDAVATEKMETVETTGHTSKAMLATCRRRGQPRQHLALKRSVAQPNLQELREGLAAMHSEVKTLLPEVDAHLKHEKPCRV